MGSFPQPTSQWFDWNTDGSIGYYTTNTSDRNNLTAMSGAQMDALCDWGPSSVSIGQVDTSNRWRSIIVVFPQPRDIRYISANHACFYAASNTWVKISTDTTNGVNGTWTKMMDATTFYNVGWHVLYQPIGVTWNNVKAIEMGGENASSYTNGTIYNFSLWGEYTDDTGLVFWDGTNDVIMPNDNFDFGDILPSTSTVREFRVKNAFTLTANTVNVGTSSGVDVGSIRSGLEFSTDGTNYSTSVSIASIAPGAISSKLYVRRTAPAGIVQNAFGTTVIRAIPASWT